MDHGRGQFLLRLDPDAGLEVTTQRGVVGLDVVHEIVIALQGQHVDDLVAGLDADRRIVTLHARIPLQNHRIPIGNELWQ